jgi:hypothetical protein
VGHAPDSARSGHDFPDSAGDRRCVRPRWAGTKVEFIFDGAIESSADERITFLTRACGGEEALLIRVVEPIEAHEAADMFLAPPLARVLEQPTCAERPGAQDGRYKLVQLIGGIGVPSAWPRGRRGTGAVGVKPRRVDGRFRATAVWRRGRLCASSRQRRTDQARATPQGRVAAWLPELLPTITLVPSCDRTTRNEVERRRRMARRVPLEQIC